MNEIGTKLPAMDVLKSLAWRVPDPASDGGPVAAARRFQELLGAMLVREMRQTLPEGFFGGGAAGDVYGGWLDEHVGAALAERDALHLERVVRESLERKAHPATQPATIELAPLHVPTSRLVPLSPVPIPLAPIQPLPMQPVPIPRAPIQPLPMQPTPMQPTPIQRVPMQSFEEPR